MTINLSKYFAGGILLLAFAFGLALAPGAFAQVLPSAPPDHIHIYVPDIDKALDWYMKHFGGMRVKDPRPNQPDEILYGKTVFRFSKHDDAKPSDGSVIDRVGFTVSDVDAMANDIIADGGKLLMRAGQPGNQVAFMQDPWGIKIEILHLANESNRLFLISLRATDPAPLMKWTLDTFGGTPDKLLGRIDGIKYGDLWVIFQKSDADTAPSRGHAIDHLGWAVPNMTEDIATFKSKGYKVTAEPRQSAPLTLAYIEGPNGFAVELTQYPPSGSK